jgi:hypothetical protein
MNDENFVCHACNTRGHINNLRHRITMRGEYCKACANYEKCAACGELCAIADAGFKDDVCNVICNGCAGDYQDVKQFIKPIYSLKNTAA